MKTHTDRLLLAVILSMASVSLAAQSLNLEDCEIRGVRGEARCGSLRVFENRDTRRGRTIDLRVVVLPARGRNSEPDPLFFLHGGPGAPATAMAPFFANSSIRDRRAIVLVDQRGTGGSNPLNCPMGDIEEVLRDLGSFAFPGMKECRDSLDADLTLYTTSIAMDDLDDVRAALGVEKINLLGGSYGTRAVLEACETWPRGRIPDDFKKPVRSRVPVLLISGETDPVTPPHLSTGLEIACVDDLGRPSFSTGR